MKKVKTLIAVFICMFCSALFGACSCSKATVSVVSIKVSETSENLIYDEANDKYLIRQGETFTVSYELGPENSSDKTVYVNVTPANKITCDTPIITTNNHTNEVMFEASTTNSGDTIIEFETKDNGKKASITVEVVGNLTPISKPTNIKYDEATSSFTWDKAYATIGESVVEATKYEVIVNGNETYATDTNSLKLNLSSGIDYFVQVKAIGTLEDRTADSEKSPEVRFYIAKTVSDFKLDNEGKLTWKYDDAKNITGYKLSIGNGRVVPLSSGTLEFPFASYVHSEGYADVNYPVSIVAINKDYVNGAPDPETGITTYISNSRSNPQLTLTKLTSPQNVKIETIKEAGSIFNSSILTWDNVTNASHYEIKITKNGDLEPTHVDSMKVGTDLNLSELLESSGEYTVEIMSKGDSSYTFSSTEYSKTTFEFVVVPMLTGSINYQTNMLNVNTTDLIDLLDLTTGEINKLDYEFFYSTRGTGDYTNVLTMQGTQEINLCQIMNADSEFYVLVRPIPTARYTSKNIVVPQVKSIDENKTISHMISQLKPVEINSVNTSGVVTAFDNNSAVKVSEYRFELFDGTTTLVQNLYRENITFDSTDTTKFTVSVVDLFKITEAKDYTLKIIPMSDIVIDANSSSTIAFTFTQLGSIDANSIVIDDNEISWGNVNKYHSYLISINGEQPEEVETNKYLIRNMSILTDNNVVTIQAIGNGENSISGSLVSTTKGRAKAVSNIKIVDGALTWDDDVANSTYFVNITHPLGNTEKVECTTNVFEGLDKIDEAASVTVVRSIPTAFNSVESDSFVIERLATLTADLSIVNNTYSATFTANNNAYAYKVKIYRGTTLVKEENLYLSGDDANATLNEGKVSFTLPTLESGNYSVYIQCLPNDQTSTDYTTNGKYYLISEYSESSEVVIYPQVELVSKTHTLSWRLATTDSVKDYVIHFTDDSRDDIVIADTTFDFADLPSGTYEITINATSNKSNVIYANPLTITIVKVATPTLTFENNSITFTNIENAESYEVYNQNNELLTADEDYSISVNESTVVIIPKNVESDFVYGMYVVPVGANDVIDGNKSNTVEYKKIGTISNVILTTSGQNKTFSWEAVENNDGYKVIIKNSSNEVLSEEVTSTNSYSIPAKFLTGDRKFEAGIYKFEVVVIGGKDNNVNLLNSDSVITNFTKLSTINGMTMNNDVISWTYQGAGVPDKYILSLLTMEADYIWNVVETFEVAHVVGTTLSFDVSQITDYDNYKISVVAVGTDATFSINSEPQIFKYGTEEIEVFEKLTAPTFTFTNGVLSFSEVVGAGRYEIYNFDGTNYTLLTNEYTLNENREVSLKDSNNTCSIVVKAIATSASGKLNSLYSEVVKINKLPSINDFVIDSTGTLTWTPVENASGYVIYNLSKDGVSTVLPGGDTCLIGYEALYADQGLTLGESCEFKIQAIGTLDTDTEINYLNSDLSSGVLINAVNNVDSETMIISNGLITWNPVDGVKSYKVDLYEKLGESSFSFVKTLTTNSASIDVTNVEQIVVGKQIVARITPFTTDNNNYVILQDQTDYAEIGFYRYNTIKSIAIENGLIKFTINIADVTSSDLQTILTVNSYTELSTEIAQKYYGHYNFRINVKGYTALNITLKDMVSVSLDLTKSELYAYYELSYEVSTTKQLELSITAIGNMGDSTTNYNAISSLASSTNKTNIVVYKYSAPKPTASENLISSNGEISFRKIHMADGTFATKYVLKARSGQEQLFYYIEIPSGQDSLESYNIGDVSQLTYSYYTDGGSLATTNIQSNKEYIFSLTTLGTESGNTGTLYLRSNTYASVAITFLADTSAMKYKFNTGDVNGGHLSWAVNDKCLSYTLFLLNSTTANELYGSEASNVKRDSAWIDADECYKVELSSETTEFIFQDTSFPSGNYWVAIRPNGNGVNYITAPLASPTLDIYKLNAVQNERLENGTFVWETVASDEDYIVGYKIIITVYSGQNHEISKIIEKGQLVTTKYYTLEESVIDTEGNTHTLTGLSEGGARETYGVSIVAIGGSVNTKQCVSSTRRNINNSGAGYARLDKVEVSINQVQRIFVWETNQTGYISEYHVYNNDTLMTGDKITNRYISFDDLTTAGDYPLEVVAIARGNEYLNSLRSDIVTIIKYYPPEVAVENGVLKWDSVQNGINLTPYGSTVAIYKDGSLLYSEPTTEFSYILDSRFPKGEYTVKVKFNDNRTVDSYSIASEEKEIVVYKLDTPVVEAVDNYSGEKECEEFDSAIKWKFITDKNGNLVQKYVVKFSVYNGDIYEIDESLTQLYDHANYATSYFAVKGEYLYFNISGLGDIVTSKVKIIVTALGNSITNEQINSAISNSQSYDALLNSSEGLIEIDYSIGKPTNASSDTINGIIRWGGSENPVLITLEHFASGNLTTDKVYISEEYIAQYGKVYYLPYMTSYKSVQLQFVIGGTYVSNTLELNVSNQTLFESGTGKQSDPYIIRDAAQFMNIKHRPLSYLQIADGVEEINLPSSWTMINSFSGHLMGYTNGSKTTQINGVTTTGSSGETIINGISIIATQESNFVNVGLFHNITSEASIKNITFNIGSNINASNGGPYNYSINMAALAVVNNGLIENVTIKGLMVGYTRHTINFGGAVVENYGILRQVTTTGFEAQLKSEPTSSSSNSSYLNAGGVSYANYNVIDSCMSNIKLNLGENAAAKNRKAGGISFQNNGLILNCDFTGNIVSWDMAGIVLENYYTKSTINYTRTYMVESDNIETSVDYNGGTVLSCSSIGTFTLYTSTKTTNNIYIGGIVGVNYGGKIGRCYVIMTPQSSMDLSGFYTSGSTMPYIGGIIGFNSIANLTEVVYPVLEHSYSIINAEFIEPSSKLQAGSAVGGYGSTVGSDIDYSANDYGLHNVVTYSTKYSPIYGVVINNTSIVEKLASSNAITTKNGEEYTYATKLNSVVSGDTTYSHSREFVGSDSYLTLQLNKIIAS